MWHSVKNDRPQAGGVFRDLYNETNVHIEMLIDRRLATHDSYGVPEEMIQSRNLKLQFEVAIFSG